MAAIKITQFGGLAPSVDPRNLSPDGAQVAQNLDMRFGDFRPVNAPGASVATVAAGTQSIFRTPSGVWLSSATDTDFVNGQINDAASERVYLTGRSAYAESWQGGAYRQLGVPKPAARPTTIVKLGATAVTADGTSAQVAAIAAVLAALSAVSIKYTSPAPATAVSSAGFWVAHGDPLAASLPTTSAADMAYLFPVYQNSSDGGYGFTNSAHEYLRTGGLPGAITKYNGSYYWAVLVSGYRFVGATLTSTQVAATLAVVANPAIPSEMLLTSVQSYALGMAIGVRSESGLALPGLLYVLAQAQAQVLATLQAPTDAVALLAKLAAVSDASATILTSCYLPSDAAITVMLSEQLSTVFGSTTDTVTRVIETRGYLITYLTDRDEESAPSLPSVLVELDQTDSVLITAAAAPTGRNIIGWKLYRSSTTNTGASFQLVDGTGATGALLASGVFRCFDIGTLTFTDDKAQEELQEPCATLAWAEPVAAMKGLVGLPNGIMAGFFGKTLCFSEPYEPFAWPIEYQLSLEFNIVGIAVFGQTAVVLTEGNPYYVSGADSSSMSAQKLESPQSCVSKRTIKPVDGGVMFASPDGLCLASPSGVAVVSQAAYSRADWQALISAGSFGAFHDGVYHLFTS